MCGIGGAIARDEQVNTARVVAMSAALEHRGPDDQGLWTHDNVALCHRRLAVVDLSPAGHQPMLSADGDWVVSYNGEIYNADSLKQELAAAWRGTSDTEVLIEAISAWGVEATCAKLVGMFSLAAFNIKTRQLYLARDRIGIKPLYYGVTASHFVFTSEVHALKPFRSELSINHDAIASHLRFSFIPAPASIYREIKKLTPGHILQIDTSNISDQKTYAFWDIEQVALQPPSTLSEDDILDELHATLRTAVGSRMIADVPLGAFLSGGYDSSLVCALMQEQASSPIRTLTIGFDDPKYNESGHAQAVADHLGTEHTELIVSETDLLDAVAQLPQLMDEPFADSSILPTYLVARMARQHVTVALSGDGGDELFWGYHRYFTAQRLWRVIDKVPAVVADTLSSLCLSRTTQKMTSTIPAPAWGGRAGMLNQKLAAAGELLGANRKQVFYEALLSHWKDPTQVLIKGTSQTTAYNDPGHWSMLMDDMARMGWQDTVTYLPDDILTKVDRASMAVSLEARVPLLDHRVVELAARIPAQMKERDGQGKYALRQILARYIPKELTDRPKMGFGVPLDQWLRGPLQEWAQDLISPSRLGPQGLFESKVVANLMDDHLAGVSNNSAKLWDVLMVQVWLDANT
ncbi:MAG: asparagine synthase (glutamine-hydrolyzing) [Pseudomonadales bacterium]|nr:asparagine synthase (glutamine-hydrolyzing) [Pseudomonadales bacterium]